MSSELQQLHQQFMTEALQSAIIDSGIAMKDQIPPGKWAMNALARLAIVLESMSADGLPQMFDEKAMWDIVATFRRGFSVHMDHVKSQTIQSKGELN